MTEQYPVISGAESFYMEGNDIGVLVCHGFVGTPQSVRTIGEAFAQLGYTVCAPRLKGHGTHYEDLEMSTDEDWFGSLEAAYVQLQKQCSTIYVLGQSMGASLAIRLANKYKEIAGLITVNAALTIPGYEQYRNVSTPRYIREGQPDIKAENVHEITYDHVPLTAIQQLQKLMERTLASLDQVTQPILAIKSRVDHVVPPTNTDDIARKVNSSSVKIVILENSYHVASMDLDQDKIIQHTHEFMMSNRTQLVI